MRMNPKIAKSSNIYETFSPLYKVLKLFGIISFELDVQNGKVSMNRFDLVWMVVLWVFWTCLIICNLYLGAREPVEHSKIILTGWHWLLIFQLGACFYIQIVSLLRRKSIGKLFQILYQIDGMNASLFYREDHTAVKSWTLKTIVGSQLINLLVSTFIIFALSAHYPDSYNPDCILYGSSLVVTLSHYVTFHQFIFVTSNIKSRFKLLNQNLKSFFASHSASAYVEARPQNSLVCNRVGFVRKLAIMHDKLNDAVEIVNHSFSYELLPGMISTALITIFAAFGIFRTVYNQDASAIISSIVNLIWAWQYLVFLIASIFVADSTTRTLSIFSQQIKHRAAVVSCGLFTIDWTLAFSMLSAVTTYLFIILQFEMSKNTVKV